MSRYLEKLHGLKETLFGLQLEYGEATSKEDRNTVSKLIKEVRQEIRLLEIEIFPFYKPQIINMTKMKPPKGFKKIGTKISDFKKAEDLDLLNNVFFVLKWLKDNINDVPVDLDDFEYYNQEHCRTYRCVCGWLAYFDGIKVKTKKNDYSVKFYKIYLANGVYNRLFERWDFKWENVFGENYYGENNIKQDLEDRLKIVSSAASCANWEKQMEQLEKDGVID